LRLQNDSSVTKCRVLRHGNRSKESFIQVIVVFCIKDHGVVLQKIPLTVCVHEIWHSASTYKVLFLSHQLKRNDTAESEVKVLTFWTFDGQNILFI
jgi:hypothetical protein